LFSRKMRSKPEANSSDDPVWTVYPVMVQAPEFHWNGRKLLSLL
jgi:hypothetical protein